MIRVLKSWEEVGAAINELKQKGLPLHTDPVKCWDLNNIARLLRAANIQPDAQILDLGCGPSMRGCITLDFLRTLGYRNLSGVDLFVPIRTRIAAAALGWVRHHTPRPYRLLRRDLTSTGLPASSISVILLLSVVEHGVDIEMLFVELSRILAPGGIVYISTDYWPEELDIRGKAASGASGNTPLPWRIFSETGIRDLIETARVHGLFPIEAEVETRAQSKPVFWQGIDYTFAAIELKKRCEG